MPDSLNDSVEVVGDPLDLLAGEVMSDRDSDHTAAPSILGDNASEWQVHSDTDSSHPSFSSGTFLPVGDRDNVLRDTRDQAYLDSYNCHEFAQISDVAQTKNCGDTAHAGFLALLTGLFENGIS